MERKFRLALRNSAIADSSLKGRKLADVQRVLCAAPAYIERHGSPSIPEQLAAHQMIAFRDQSSKRLVGPGGALGQFNPGESSCRLTLDDGLSQKAVTLAGAGISMNSLWNVYSELQDCSLVRVLPDYEVDDQSVLWLVYPKSNALTAKVRSFIDFLLDRIGRRPPWLAPV